MLSLVTSSLVPEVEGLIARIEKMLKRASGQAEIETRLVGDLLDLSRLEMHKFELCVQRENLVTIVQETVANQMQARRSQQIELILSFSEVVPVLVDAGRIGQVLTNYLTNALKHSPLDRVICVHLEVTGTVARVSVRVPVRSAAMQLGRKRSQLIMPLRASSLTRKQSLTLLGETSLSWSAGHWVPTSPFGRLLLIPVLWQGLLSLTALFRSSSSMIQAS